MDKLIRWAYLNAIVEKDWDSLSDKEKAVVSAETVSRVWAVKTLRDINPSLDIIQMDFGSEYDCKIWSGGTWYKVEHKFRDYPSAKFDTALLSPKKFQYCVDNGVWLLCTYNDGSYFLWDNLAECNVKRKPTEHNKTNVSPKDGKITENCVYIKYNEAKYRGKLTLSKN